MPRKSVRLLAGLVILASVPVVAAATPAQAGDQIEDPAFDFDCDDKRDAIDEDWGETVNGRESAGVVRVQYSTTGDKAAISQATDGIAGSPETGDNFGWTSTSYDENGDGCDDLVVSAFGEDLTDKNGVPRSAAGMVTIIPGSPSGLDTRASRNLHLDTPGIPGSLADSKRFGEVLAAANSTSDPYLTIGMPWGYNESGAVYFLRGGKTLRITQDSPGVTGSAETDDRFGSVLSVTDRYVAIGTPRENIGGNDVAGMVHVFGLKTVNGTLQQRGAFHQDTPGISGVAEAYDGFGGGLSIIDYRPTPASPVIPLLAVGTGEEFADDGSGRGDGLVQLVTVPSTGKYTQTASLRDIPDAPGDGVSYGVFGSDTALAVRGSSTVGTPETTTLAVTVYGHDGERDTYFPEMRVFGDITDSGDVKVVKDSDFGLPMDRDRDVEVTIDASAGYLYVSYPRFIIRPSAVYGIPWGNVLNGENEPTVVYRVAA